VTSLAEGSTSTEWRSAGAPESGDGPRGEVVDHAVGIEVALREITGIRNVVSVLIREATAADLTGIEQAGVIGVLRIDDRDGAGIDARPVVAGCSDEAMVVVEGTG
jgi:hypothetical protein